MKGVTTDSPRTSAGISKSLLTPCRRLGLTRRRAVGASPSTPQDSPASYATPSGARKSNTSHTPDLVSTPARILGQPRRQKSKKLISALASTESPSQEKTPHVVEDDETSSSNKPTAKSLESADYIDDNDDLEVPTKCAQFVDNEISSVEIEEKEVPSTPNPSKKTQRNTHNEMPAPVQNIDNDNIDPAGKEVEKVALPIRKKSKEKTPKRLSKRKSSDLNLKRKCMVVIDNLVLKSKNEKSPVTTLITKENECNLAVEINGDSKKIIDLTKEHPDDVPLSEISKNLSIEHNQDFSVIAKKRPRTLILDEEDSEFCEKVIKRSNHIEKAQPNNPKVAKLEKNKITISTSSNELKEMVTALNKLPRSFPPGSDSEGDDFDCRKTILIRKSYPKAIQKAKSTGSITQKDIDDIKARIRMKQNILLAKSEGHNIEELGGLIKKWRKGCQEALMELLEIMKRKFPEKEKMNTAELLKMLNIPMELVNYNAEDDFFISPE